MATSPETLIKDKDNLKLLPSLEADCPLLWKYFLVCSETPRVPHKLEQIQKKLTDLAKTLGLESKIDSAGNVLIRKPASNASFAKAPSVCIQAHMDMVCSKNDSVEHDFETEPVRLVVDQHWLKADGTTLGADDGIGVAAMLALLEDDSFDHPALECLFTANEETDMSGAENIDPTLVDSRLMVNVDSEEEYAICIGCAGGFERKFYLPLERSSQQTSDKKRIQVTINGGSGGHTGVQIHEGKANAIKLIAQVLRQVNLSNPIELVAVCGGSAVNTIPREASVIIQIPSESLTRVEYALNQAMNKLKQDYGETDINLALFTFGCDALDSQENFTAATSSSKLILLPYSKWTPPAVNHNDTKKALNFMCTIPHGVVRMDQGVSGLVETSVSFSIVDLEETELMCHTFVRSSCNSQSDLMSQNLESLAELCNARVTESFSGFPAWQPNMSSPSLRVMHVAHQNVMGKQARVYAIHAGLECAFFQAAFPGMDCVSIGPTIENAHTPDEKILIASVPRFYKLLKEFLTLSLTKL